MTTTENVTFTKTQAKTSDAVHAELQTAAYKASDRVGWAIDMLHRAANDNYKGRSAKSGWKLTDQEAFDSARAISENDEGITLSDGTVIPTRDAQRATDAVKTYREAVIARDAAREALCAHDEWDRHGRWSRFFLVQGGHIHSSTGCHTLYPTTRIGWLPKLSGETEAEAVAAHGALLCTVCFPTAPVEWTDGRKAGDEDNCVGSGTWNYPRETARMGYYSGNYGVCKHCDGRITISSTGKMRKHKKAK